MFVYLDCNDIVSFHKSKIWSSKFIRLITEMPYSTILLHAVMETPKQSTII